MAISKRPSGKNHNLLNESMYYSAVKIVLKVFGIPAYYYSIGEAADDCVCLECKMGRWFVYETSRGDIIHSRSFLNAYDAGCCLFGSVAIGEVKVGLMKNCLKQIIVMFENRALFKGIPYTSSSQRYLEGPMSQVKQKAIQLEEMLRIDGFRKDNEETAEVREKKEVYNAVEDILKQFEIPVYYYSIGEPADDCVCFEYKEGKWVVYDNSRGEIIHSRSFDDAYEAGCSLFGSVAIGEDKVASMRRSLESKINNYVIVSKLRERGIRLQAEIAELLELVAKLDYAYTDLIISESRVPRNKRKKESSGQLGHIPIYQANESGVTMDTILTGIEPYHSKKVHLYGEFQDNPGDLVSAELHFANEEDAGTVKLPDGTVIKLFKTERSVTTKSHPEESRDTKKEENSSKRQVSRYKRTITGKKKN